MFVLDASAAVDLLLETQAGAQWRDRVMDPGQSLHAPHLIDIEILSALRRWAARGELTPDAARQAAMRLSAMRIVRYGHLLLLPRVWELRLNVTTYDAAYLALAETLGAPLLTSDTRLSRSHGHNARIVLLR